PVRLRADRVRHALRAHDRRRRYACGYPHALVVLDVRAVCGFLPAHPTRPHLVTAAELRVEAVDIVLGTCAHACANGAAAGVPCDACVAPVFAVADAVSRSAVAPTTAPSQSRLCITLPSSR